MRDTQIKLCQKTAEEEKNIYKTDRKYDEKIK